MRRLTAQHQFHPDLRSLWDTNSKSYLGSEFLQQCLVEFVRMQHRGGGSLLSTVALFSKILMLYTAQYDDYSCCDCALQVYRRLSEVLGLSEESMVLSVFVRKMSVSSFCRVEMRISILYLWVVFVFVSTVFINTDIETTFAKSEDISPFSVTAARIPS